MLSTKTSNYDKCHVAPLGPAQDGGAIAKFSKFLNGGARVTNNSNYPFTSSDKIQQDFFI